MLQETVTDRHMGAEGLRLAANGLTIGRALGGVALGIQIGRGEYPVDSVWPMYATIGSALTDLADGRLAGWATRLDGKTSRFGAWADNLADKFFVTCVAAGIVCASLTEGRTGVGAVVAASGGVFVVRDVYVTRKRLQAELHNSHNDGDQIETKADWHGKIKAAFQFVSLTALTSPFMESPTTNWVAAAGLAVSAGAAVLSGLKYRTSFNTALRTNTALNPEQ